MKQLFIFCTAALAMTMVSCSWCDGPDYILEDEYVEDTNIKTIGIHSIITRGVNSFVVQVDSVRIVDESVDLNDTTSYKPENVNFSKSRQSVQILNKEIKFRNSDYVIYKMLCVVKISLEGGIVVPVYFTREVIYAVCNNGTEVGDYYAFKFDVTGKYVGSERQITYEESHSRSYYDLVISVSDKDEAIGTIRTRVSFFTANTPIAFSACVSNWEESDTITDL